MRHGGCPRRENGQVGTKSRVRKASVARLSRHGPDLPVVVADVQFSRSARTAGDVFSSGPRSARPDISVIPTVLVMVTVAINDHANPPGFEFEGCWTVGFGKRTNLSGLDFFDNHSQGTRTPKLRAFIGSTLRSVGVDQSSRPEDGNDLPQAGVGYREASLHQGARGMLGMAMIMALTPRTRRRTLSHSSAREAALSIGWIEPVETHRMAVGADIQGAGAKSTRGCCVRTGVVRKAFQPSGMGRIRATTVCHQVRFHVPRGEVHDMKSRGP